MSRPSDYEIGDELPNAGKVPPHSDDTEVALLSAALEDERALLKALAIIDADSFYRESHRRIFAAMVRMLECAHKIDPVTLSQHLEDRGELASVGGREFIYGQITDAVPTTENVEYYARIVHEKAERRRLLVIVANARAALMDSAIPVRQIATDLQTTLVSSTLEPGRDGFVRIKEDLWAILQSIEADASGARAKNVVRTWYPEIDSKISGGFERGHFVVFAGVPGSAKTAAVLNIAINVATQGENPLGVAFVSAEMTRPQLIRRTLANIGRVPLTNLRSGKLQDHDWPRMARAGGILSPAPFWVDQTPTPGIEDVVAKCRSLKAEHPEIALIIVDFIQLVQRQMADRRMKEENRSAELTKISYALAGLSKELDVVTIATSQVDAAAIENRQDRRPRLGDARWSQGMREAANLFATVYRPQMYEKQLPDTLELAFQKGRDDPPFTAEFDFIGQYMVMTSRIGVSSSEPSTEYSLRTNTPRQSGLAI
jgi:replicative DNA helicase